MSDDAFLVHDGSFRAVLGAAPALVDVVACDAHEGPVYLALEDALYLTSLPTRERPAEIVRIALDGERFPVEGERVTRVATTATMPNGMAAAPDATLIVCEQGDLGHDACVSRVDPRTGARSVMVDSWRGRRVNSPNDVAVGPDGAIWFTDPTYGFLQGFRPAPELGAFVYRYDPCRDVLDVVADGFDQPNGIALSPDGATLYVGDSGAIQAPGTHFPDRPHHVEAFDVSSSRLTARRLFAVTAPGFPDGLKTDAAGRVYVSASSGVLVYSPDGRLLGEIVVPGAVNFAFGGAHGNLLFITTDTAVRVAVLAATGPSQPSLVPLVDAIAQGV